MKRDIIESPFLFKMWMRGCSSVFSLDTETTSLNWLDLEIIGFSIADNKQACYVILEDNKYKRKLLSILKFYISEAKLIIFHNFAFDGMVLRKEGIEI